MFKLAILIVSSPSSGVQAKIKTEIMIEHHYKGTRNSFSALLYELRLKVMQENGFFLLWSLSPINLCFQSAEDFRLNLKS